MYDPSTISTSISQVVNRLQLHFYDLQQVVGGDGIAVARMLDEHEQRSLNVVVDEPLAAQLALRTGNNPECKRMLPETLYDLLSQVVGQKPLEITVYAIRNGQYHVMLLNRYTLNTVAIRISDAILLSVVADVPFYVEANLMNHQSTPFDREASGVGLPINTLDTPRLNAILKKAISDEDYELAAHVRDELQTREGDK